MRGKASSIGFELPKQAQKSRRGRPRKYGDKVILSNLFDKIKGLFTAATINLYGKEESVEYLYKDLLWKPVGRILRFVMVKTSNNLSSITKDKDKEKIISTMKTIEVYTFLSCLAMGILSIISLKFPELV